MPPPIEPSNSPSQNGCSTPPTEWQSSELESIAKDIERRIGIATPTPVIELFDALWQDRNIRFLVKRDDLTHPLVQGNKWRKLMYNLAECLRLGKSTVVTVGGAHSNHLISVAAAANKLGLASVGFVRGTELLNETPTLRLVTSLGMSLRGIERNDFHEMFYESAEAPKHLLSSSDYFVPAGGTNTFALGGLRQLVEEFPKGIGTVYCACGTSGTLAGIAAFVPEGVSCVGISTLKGTGYLEELTRSLYARAQIADRHNWAISYDYHFGGFAKLKPELTAFSERFSHRHQIPLDRVYTAKMFFGILDLLARNAVPPNTTLLAVHTGGVFANLT